MLLFIQFNYRRTFETQNGCRHTPFPSLEHHIHNTEWATPRMIIMAK
jgi:hypothetical protein